MNESNQDYILKLKDEIRLLQKRLGQINVEFVSQQAELNELRSRLLCVHDLTTVTQNPSVSYADPE